MSLEKFLKQERLPVCTRISLFTTVAVEMFLLFAGWSLPGAGFGRLGIVLSAGLVVVVGLIANTVAGSIAHERGEYWGGRIATSGIAVWLATIAAAIWAKLIFPG